MWLAYLLLFFGYSNAQRFFNGIPGASQVSSRPSPSVRQEVAIDSGEILTEQIDRALESALIAASASPKRTSQRNSVDESVVRGSARGAPPTNRRLQAFGRRPDVADTSRPPVVETRAPQEPLAKEAGTGNRRISFRPSNRRIQTLQQRQRTEPIEEPQVVARPLAESRQEAEVIRASNSNPTNTLSAQTTSFVRNTGNERVFDPSQNPLGETRRPKIQQFGDLGGRGAQDRGNSDALQPLPNDFLPSCPDATFSYIIPSPTQCDLYYVCEFGNPSKKVCEDGLVFSIDEVKCVPSDIGDCKDRPLLQSPKGSGPCIRRNGIFYTNDTCTDFVTCRDNNPSYERCAEGLVFDPQQKICAWADEALRPGCMPEDLLGFRCPNPKLTQEEAVLHRIHLRFGDHDRHADPSDCRYFFMCLVTGQPRRAGCGRGKVFDRATGICRLAKDVPECSDYYGSAQAQSSGSSQGQATDARILRIQEDISRQFQTGGGIPGRTSQLLTRGKRELYEFADPEGF